MAYNKKAVLEGNTEAIRVILRLEKERREATEAEKVLLRGYQGFGGLKCVLNRCDNPDDLRYWSASEQNLFAPGEICDEMNLFVELAIANALGLFNAQSLGFVHFVVGIAAFKEEDIAIAFEG